MIKAEGRAKQRINEWEVRSQKKEKQKIGKMRGETTDDEDTI